MQRKRNWGKRDKRNRKKSPEIAFGFGFVSDLCVRCACTANLRCDWLVKTNLIAVSVIIRCDSCARSEPFKSLIAAFGPRECGARAEHQINMCTENIVRFWPATQASIAVCHLHCWRCVVRRFESIHHGSWWWVHQPLSVVKLLPNGIITVSCTQRADRIEIERSHCKMNLLMNRRLMVTVKLN